MSESWNIHRICPQPIKSEVSLVGTSLSDVSGVEVLGKPQGPNWAVALLLVALVVHLGSSLAGDHIGASIWEKHDLGSSMFTAVPELSWTSGQSFPRFEGSTVFPAIVASEAPPSFDAHWYAGSLYPADAPPRRARTVSTRIGIPSSAPKSDEFYYVLLSVWDSAGSYDQIGFSNSYGVWGLTYCWTSGLIGNPTYHYSPNAREMSTGVTYTFSITVEGGVAHYVAYDGTRQIWSLDARTGGEYLVLDDLFRGYYDYTDYEEVWQTSDLGGAPPFDFNFTNNYWVSVDNSSSSAEWTRWETSGTPLSVEVSIGGDDVFVDNPSPALTVSTTVTSSPAGLGFVRVDDVAVTTPKTYTWPIGSTHTLEAVSPVIGLNVQYSWRNWSNGGAQSHSYVVPAYSQAVTAYFNQSLYFADGFESGSFNGWSGTGASSGETVSATSLMSHHDSSSAVFATNGGGGYESAFCYENMTSGDLYARGYFYVSKSGIDSDNDCFYLIVFKSSAEGLAYAGWKMTSGGVRWCLTTRDRGSYFDVFSSTSPSVNRWYCVELHRERDGSNAMWVDGALVCSHAGDLGEIISEQFGLAELYGCGTTMVYCDCVKVADRHVGPESKPSIAFEDSYESGGFTTWSGTSLTTGASAAITGSPTHHGLHSADFGTNGGLGFEHSYSYETIAPSSDLYARGYFYVSQSGIVADDDHSYFILFKAGNNNVAYVGWRKSAGTVKWSMTLRNGAGYVDLYSSSESPSTGRWYSVELHWVKDPSNGYAQLWVDGLLACSSTSGDTTAYGDATQVQFGLAKAKGGSTTAYCDCAAINSSSLGPEGGRKVGSISISASTNPTSVKLGTNIIGSLTPERVGSTILIKYRFLGKSASWISSATVKTDKNSEYSYSWVPSMAAAYELQASWAGDDETLPAESPVTRVNCLPVQTHISLLTSSSSTMAGLEVNATGRLVDIYGGVLKNETIVLYYSLGRLSSWLPIASDRSDDSGNYSITWIPTGTGCFLLKAEWAGNETHSCAKSNVTVSSTSYRNQYVFTVESNSSISGQAFDEADQSLRFSVSGPNGTRGYARVTVAKILVAGPLNVGVFVDGVEKDFRTVSANDSYLLFFDYSHSVHRVVVDLDITVVPEFPESMVLPLLMVATLLGVLFSVKTLSAKREHKMMCYTSHQ
jgi:hypothetical protein